MDMRFAVSSFDVWSPLKIPLRNNSRHHHPWSKLDLGWGMQSRTPPCPLTSRQDPYAMGFAAQYGSYLPVSIFSCLTSQNSWGIRLYMCLCGFFKSKSSANTPSIWLQKCKNLSNDWPKSFLIGNSSLYKRSILSGVWGCGVHILCCLKLSFPSVMYFDNWDISMRSSGFFCVLVYQVAFLQGLCCLELLFGVVDFILRLVVFGVFCVQLFVSNDGKKCHKKTWTSKQSQRSNGYIGKGFSKERSSYSISTGFVIIQVYANTKYY